MSDGDLWLPALVAAFLTTATTTPTCRWLAGRIGLVDKPAERKIHVRPVPYLGGLALTIGAVVGAVGSGALSERSGAILLVAALAGVIGLFDDHEPLSPRVRLTVHVLAAAALALAGVGEGIVGIRVVDVAIATIVIAAATNAVNLCDNMDGLASSMTAAVAIGCLLIGLAVSDPAVPVLSAALGGACFGFLVFNGPPATVFMGDAGSTFLGCALGALVLEAAAAAGKAEGALVGPTAGLLLLSVFALDSGTVIVARPRHGRKISLAGKDHLSHRLVALGLSRTSAVGVLFGVTSSVTVTAILVGAGAVPPALGLVPAVSVLCALAYRTWRADVYGRVTEPSATGTSDAVATSPAL
ncbi:MAG: MraY family glycosyltransferase [Actinomycetota bacterium]|nr:MraY family glycosyltransferase [Actinomycetota bacterium]